MLLTRNEILEAKDVKTEIVPVPEWGGDVKVRSLTGTERDALEFALQDDKTNIRAKFAAAAIVDDNGAQVFSAPDIEALGSKSGKALGRVFTAIQRISGLTSDAVEDAEKNSVATPIADSTSDSPKISE